MGIIRNIKNWAVAKVSAGMEKAADGIAKAAQLTENQIRDIEKKREEYLAEKPNVNGDQIQVKRTLGAIGVEVFHAYLPELGELYTPQKTIPSNFDDKNRIRSFDITKWVFDNEENYLDKLVNVYHVLSQEDCTIALIFHRTMSGCQVTMAVVNNSEDSDPSIVSTLNDRIQDSLRGNFPGAVFSSTSCGIPKSLSNYRDANIAAITNIATEKSDKFISQSIEKMLDGVVPQKKEQEYSFVLLATPSSDTLSNKCRLSELYSILAPLATWQTNYSVSSTDAVSASANAGLNLGVGFAKSHSTSVTVGLPPATATAGVTSSRSINFGANFSRSSSVNVSVGKNEGVTQSFTNHQIKHTLDVLDMQMKRLEQCSSLGMWEFASYVISEDFNTANNAAHMYLALTQGEESFVSQAAINLWHCGKKQEETKTLLWEISHLHHPAFCLRQDLANEDDDWLMYPPLVDATTSVSGRELAFAFNLPKKSVAGFPVIECAEFGRNIVTYNERNASESRIELGHIFHMHHEENSAVTLTTHSLASHTFITGSTGAGKSNTIYQILNEAKRQNIPFLVIEPAKGEYKHIFGNQDNVSVYGTNSAIMPLLHLNPFSFPTGIHILEHLDRLVEIFNVCWPMYAAMPAVLKNAVEKAYEDCGWNLTESSNPYGDDLYPCFTDVARNIKTIIDSSEYDAENKGAYKGSLLTRLQSLTNGINGMIFSQDELSAEALFDRNVIVDLSRVGSTETKSLLMGILVLKLQEYRMCSDGMSSGLCHITVLEEAHHLLKRTSTEQAAESGNLLGKSVEMISNAIAEMRSKGEGFIIADQAPGLLDMAVIRNTNTKIILRLPDQTDRELVGKAAGLKDDQISEIAKLPCGVAAVYQNDWIQAVLCKVKCVDTGAASYKPSPESTVQQQNCMNGKLCIAELLSNGTQIAHESIIKEIVPILQELKLSAFAKVSIIRNLKKPASAPRMTKLAPVFCELFSEVRKAVVSGYTDSRLPAEWTKAAEQALRNMSEQSISERVRRVIVQAVITGVIYNDLNRLDDLKRWSKEGNF